MSEAPCTWAGAYRPHPPAGLACDTVLRLAMPDMRGPGGPPPGLPPPPPPPGPHGPLWCEVRLPPRRF
eukprot:CAMPEP_0177623764 /NCGR_PEP_ID=MMETSP0419_2-20121207/29088_1 /TAXON_ID=582737 /ORGANISM="Tetraselmis sp., Strain GSL018" /LENGTH=67 /DNA_ID=CAMNT_0019124361 /DNA_START=194 /DNA_END=397 /DNA_ORIENTATION=-